MESSSCDIYTAVWEEDGGYKNGAARRNSALTLNPNPNNPNSSSPSSSSAASSSPQSNPSPFPSPSPSPATRTVIIKMIRADRVGSAVAVAEFDTEEALLSNMSHPHIVTLLGSGRYPRKFLVLELLEGGTLSHALLGSAATSRHL